MKIKFPSPFTFDKFIEELKIYFSVMVMIMIPLEYFKEIGVFDYNIKFGMSTIEFAFYCLIYFFVVRLGWNLVISWCEKG